MPGVQKLKALVLCAGKGTRLRPLTDTIAKPLIPVANKPILFYVLDQIKEAGITQIGLVVSPDNKEQIREVVGNGSRWEAKISYIVQTEAKGIAHAVLTAEEFLGDSAFLLFLGDNLLKGSIKPVVDRFFQNKASALIVLKEVSDPSMFGVAELDGAGNVLRLVEKPKEPKSNTVLVGVYLFSSLILHAAKQIVPSHRGEFEITDAIQWLIDHDKTVLSDTVCGWWLDTGKKDDLLTANKVVLEDFVSPCLLGEIDNDSCVNGMVEIGEGTKIINSRINGPVSIGEDGRIENSIIGPFASIGAKTVIENAAIENSVILENCRVTGAGLKDSIIGKHADIKAIAKCSAVLFLGSYSRIEI